jgi:ketosteroid isomerase-like protein
MSNDPRTLATTYFRAWQERDFATLRSILAPDVTFRGTLGTADGAEQCVEGMAGLAKVISGIEISAMAVAGADVMTWYELRTTVAPPCPTVNWSHVEDGKITRIRAVFDPRDLLKGMSQG